MGFVRVVCFGVAACFALYILLPPDPAKRVEYLVGVGIVVLLHVAYIVLGKNRFHDFGLFPREEQRLLWSFFRPALSTAAAGRQEEGGRLLADIHDTPRDGSTALHDACNSTVSRRLNSSCQSPVAIDDFSSQLPYKCHQNRVASEGFAPALPPGWRAEAMRRAACEAFCMGPWCG